MNRADRLLSVLTSQPHPFTRSEIFTRVGFMLTNNAASELRARGYEVEHSTEAVSGRTVHSYRLVSSPETAPRVRAASDAGLTAGRREASGVGNEPEREAVSGDATGQLTLEAA